MDFYSQACPSDKHFTNVFIDTTAYFWSGVGQVSQLAQYKWFDSGKRGSCNDVLYPR
jgi:hypothetical protein